MRVGADVRSVSAGLNQTKQMMNSTAEAGKTMNSHLSGAFGGIAKAALGMAGIAGVGAAIAAVGKFASQSIAFAKEAQGVTAAFEGITGGGRDMLAALQDASAGMVTNTELMKNYNSAAQLVSKSFADQLPEAMQYLTKIAASTGQSMDYMMTSLVRGVGRMSPMILDNLNAQVSLADATARASEMFGVQADALTKTQEQAGMMSVVLEKLKANTAALPDVMGTAAQASATFSTKLANLKTEAGEKLLPAFSSLMDTASQLLDTLADSGVIDAFAGGLSRLLDVVGSVASKISEVVGAFGELKRAHDEEIRALAEASSSLEEFERALPRIGMSAQYNADQIKDIWRGVHINWREDLTDISELTDTKFKEMMRGAAAAVKKGGDDIGDILAKVGSAFETAWSDAFGEIEDTMRDHYREMEQLSGNAHLDAVRAEVEYNTKRAQMVAAGMTDELAELDRGYQNAQVMRELDRKLAVIEAQAKYQDELDEQMKAFGQKMALWVTEAVTHEKMTAAEGNAVLDVLARVFGAEVSAHAQLALDVLRIGQQSADDEW